MFTEGRHCLRRHQDASGGYGVARSRGFTARVDHLYAAFVIDVRKLVHLPKVGQNGPNTRN
jgi:hypothetical protein